MKVLILGSGVIGVSTAYYLAKSGHEVTVVDRRDGPGLETSYGNAGEVSPGYSSPWAAPKLVWGSKPPGRPEEFHLQPPTEPCVNLSIYTARPSHCPAISR